MDEWQPIRWLTQSTMLTVSVGSLIALLVAFAFGCWLHSRSFGAGKTSSLEQGQEGLIVSGVMVVLGLLLGFTFSLALDRFEQRRMLVVTEANAIGTSYLRAQLLDEPDRTRLSQLLVAYTDNRIELGSEPSSSERKALVQKNDRLLTQIWAAVSAALDTPKGKTISTPLTLTFNEMIDLDTERKVARTASIPGLVLLMLYLFLIVASGVVGFILSGKRQRVMALVMFGLFWLAMTIIADLIRPTAGTILESQQPMLITQKLLEQPRPDFDQFKGRPGTPASQAGSNR
jgi:hypothetical protein